MVKYTRTVASKYHSYLLQFGQTFFGVETYITRLKFVAFLQVEVNSTTIDESVVVEASPAAIGEDVHEETFLQLFAV